MLRNFTSVYLFAVLCALIVTPAQATVQRAYVASWGNDSNAAYDCWITTPCRWFYTAVTVVSPNGEVVALDSAAYGPVTLTQSISLTSAPGAYAGMSVFPVSTAGVTIATSGVNVVLRGLTINGQGGPAGVLMTNGAQLSIENCVISNFSGAGQRGIFVNAAATVRIVNTLVRDNDTGVELQGGATATISRSKFLGNGLGIFANGTIATTSATVRDSLVTGGNTGILAWSQTTSAINQINVIRSTISNNYGAGISSEAHPNGTASVTISKNMITANNFGLFIQGGAAGSSATLKSYGNNTITDNSVEASSPPTLVSPI